jgi:hypothetical protein
MAGNADEFGTGWQRWNLQAWLDYVLIKMLPEGELEMFIPRCWMHTAPGDGRTQDEACVQGCKGACERLFGPEAPMTMLFEPHLPEYSCTLRAKMGAGAPQQA